MNRPTWDETFLEIMRTIGKRSTCDRGRVGCIIVCDNKIISTGYAGSPKGLKHCDDEGHEFKDVIHEDGSRTRHCIRTVHAELNAVINAAKLGRSTMGATLYCSMTPCRTCASAIINAGIVRVVAEKKYQDSTDSELLFKKAGIKLEYVSEVVKVYGGVNE